MIFGGCSTEEDMTQTSEAVTRNSDGSFTLYAITNVGLPYNYATTRATSSSATGDKTSWSTGDRLHIDYDNGTEHLYRYATLQSDGSTWKLNEALTITDTKNLHIDFLGSKYNVIDFNDVASGPSGISSAGTTYNNTTAINRLNNTYDYLLYIPQANTFSDILSASGDNDITQAADGKLTISMKHQSNRIAITSADISSLGSGITVSSITASITNSDNTPFATLGLSATSGDAQPSTSMPWYAQVNDKAGYLTGFTVTLSDNRKIYVPVPDENGSTTGNGRNINGVSGKIFTYRLILGPGNVTATPDASFTAPGWNSTTTIGINTNIIPIYDRAGLEAISNNLGGNYILMNDIDLSGKEWTPIGAPWSYLNGHFDGNGHKITGMTINYANYQYSALFCGINSKAIIYNLHLVNPAVNNTYTSSFGNAGIVGVNNGYISNCSITGGTISSVRAGSGGYIGGIAALNNSAGGIIHCRVTGTTFSQPGTFSTAGGIAGTNQCGWIIASYANGCTITNTAYQGGIVGYSTSGNSNVFGCYAVAPTITNTGAYAGLIVGFNGSGATISSCYGTNITGQSSTLCGNSGVLTNCVEPTETERTNLVSSPAPTLDVKSIIRAADGTLSTVSRTWKATGIWGYAEGSTIYTYPNIVWGYEGE